MRFTKEYRDIAKQERGTLFKVTYDRKYTIPSDKGGSHECWGVTGLEGLLALRFASIVAGGGNGLKFLALELEKHPDLPQITQKLPKSEP
jgi:hypothetical protein